jgi:hypothetical protein
MVSYACERRVDGETSGAGGTALAGGGGPGGSGAGAAGPGGSGAGGSVGPGGSGPTCGEPQPLVHACAASSAGIPAEGLPTTTVVGNLTRAELTDAASTCFADSGLSVGGVPPLTEQVVALQVVNSGVTWDVALELPGASLAGLTVGDEVELSLRAEYFDFESYAHVVVRRQGAVVLAAALDESPGMVIAAGDVECQNGPDECCESVAHAMSVTVGKETVDVPTDSSAPVGGLLVTNDKFHSVYDTGGCCNISSPAFVVGAAALSESP